MSQCCCLRDLETIQATCTSISMVSQPLIYGLISRATCLVSTEHLLLLANSPGKRLKCRGLRSIEALSDSLAPSIDLRLIVLGISVVQLLCFHRSPSLSIFRAWSIAASGSIDLDTGEHSCRLECRGPKDRFSRGAFTNHQLGDCNWPTCRYHCHSNHLGDQGTIHS